MSREKETTAKAAGFSYSYVGTGPSYEEYPQPVQAAARGYQARHGHRRSPVAATCAPMECNALCDWLRRQGGGSQGKRRKEKYKDKTKGQETQPAADHLLPRNDPADPPIKLQQCSELCLCQSQM